MEPTEPISGTIPITPEADTPPSTPEPAADNLLTTGHESPKSPEPIPVVSQPEPEKELYTWQAPSRPFKKRNREFYATVGALVLLVSVILLFAKEFLLIGVILSFGFVTYVLSTVPPQTIKHRLTNKGIRSADKLWLWGTLGRYWWENKWHQPQLLIEAPNLFPGRLTLLLGSGDKKAINNLVSKYLVNQKPEPTSFDKATKWLSEKVPLESDEDLPPPSPASTG
jgi:hypothetical protein